MNKKILFLVFSSILFLVTGCKTDSAINVNADIGANEKQTLSSLTKIDDFPFYTMKFYADYGFSDKIQIKKNSNTESLKIKLDENRGWGCACFTAFGDKTKMYFGRNFDWHYCIPMLLYTKPKDGHASVSIVDLEYLGYNSTNLPDDNNNRQRLLNAPSLPFDGINENGVAIGMMAVSEGSAPYDPSKIIISDLELIRLVLDYADNVDHAIQLISKYNIRIGNPPLHYLIGDRSGNSAVVEFVNGQMRVMKSQNPFNVSTNFIIHGSDAPENTNCSRYDKAYEFLKTNNGKLSSETSMSLLKDISQSNTIWSVVYDVNSFDIQVVLNRNYLKAHSFKFNSY